jgi:exosome complex RNA-binding protein Rrp4
MNYYFPGDRICASNNKTATGHGTYERHGYIFASLAGFLNKTETEDQVRESIPQLMHFI